MIKILALPSESQINHPSVKDYKRTEKLITILSKYFGVLILITCYAILLNPIILAMLKDGPFKESLVGNLPLKIM